MRELHVMCVCVIYHLYSRRVPNLLRPSRKIGLYTHGGISNRGNLVETPKEAAAIATLLGRGVMCRSVKRTIGKKTKAHHSPPRGMFRLKSHGSGSCKIDTGHVYTTITLNAMEGGAEKSNKSPR